MVESPGAALALTAFLPVLLAPTFS